MELTADIEVTNSELVICHLDDGATLNMELTADIGKGYVPSQSNRPADAPIGLIPVDALYSPVRQVAYKVENTRVGHRDAQNFENHRVRRGIRCRSQAQSAMRTAPTSTVASDRLGVMVMVDGPITDIAD